MLTSTKAETLDVLQSCIIVYVLVHSSATNILYLSQYLHQYPSVYYNGQPSAKINTKPLPNQLSGRPNHSQSDTVAV